jgi:hypothetical protein
MAERSGRRSTRRSQDSRRRRRPPTSRCGRSGLGASPGGGSTRCIGADLARDRDRVVGRAAVDDDDLVDRRQALEDHREIVLVVERRDDDAYRR